VLDVAEPHGVLGWPIADENLQSGVHGDVVLRLCGHGFPLLGFDVSGAGRQPLGRTQVVRSRFKTAVDGFTVPTR
jgi:hypothetical protein